MKRGMILLETMISLWLLIVCILISLNVCSILIQSTEKRYNKEQMNEAIYSVCSEIRYNIPFSVIQSWLIDGPKYIKYNNNFTYELESHQLIDFESYNNSGKYIKISNESSSEDVMKINVLIKCDDISVNQELTKAIWMDEV